jgi:hypothetical protein
MNEESKPHLFAVDGHPDEDQLLLALERELPVDDATRVELHLGNCWSCRARFDEMQRGILAFVEYREKRYLPSLATPPDDSSDFRDRLRNIVRESSPVDLRTRIWRKLVALLALPRHVKWASAVATGMAIVILWVQVLVNPPAVSANELLTRALAAQNPPATREKSTQHRVARQKVQIRSGKQTVVRDFEWKVGSLIARARWEIQPDPLAWNAPMTAEGFATWRNSLRGKKDKVKRSADLLTLDTTTGQDRIKEARIVVRADDFHPVEQHLRFTDDQQLDFTELAFQIVDESQPALEPGFQVAAPPKPSGIAPKADLVEAELQLRYTLFVNGWDLGEDLVIGRASGQVILSGTVSSRERGEAMQAVLTALPNVQLSIDLPSSSNARVARLNSALATKDLAISSAPLLSDVLENVFASREERLAFVDRSLVVSDTALSHAWTLKRLADRYSEGEERLLKPESDEKLRQMLRAHLQGLSRANSGLEALLELLPASNSATTAIPSNWQARLLSLFTAVQQQDRLVASLVVGSQSDVQNIATASADLRSAHQAINVLLGGLKDLAGDPTTR